MIIDPFIQGSVMVTELLISMLWCLITSHLIKGNWLKFYFFLLIRINCDFVL